VLPRNRMCLLTALERLRPIEGENVKKVLAGLGTTNDPKRSLTIAGFNLNAKV